MDLFGRTNLPVREVKNAHVEYFQHETSSQERFVQQHIINIYIYIYVVFVLWVRAGRWEGVSVFLFTFGYKHYTYKHGLRPKNEIISKTCGRGEMCDVPRTIWCTVDTRKVLQRFLFESTAAGYVTLCCPHVT